jgi:chromosome segregation ATPase
MSFISKYFVFLIITLVIGGAFTAVGSYLSIESSNVQELNNQLALQKQALNNVTQQLSDTVKLIQKLENVTTQLKDQLLVLNTNSINNNYTLNIQNQTIQNLNQQIFNLSKQILLLSEQSNITVMNLYKINETINTKYSQLNVLQYQVQNVTADISGINQKISSLQNQIYSINSEVSQLAKQIAQLQQEIQQIINKEDKDHSND